MHEDPVLPMVDASAPVSEPYRAAADVVDVPVGTEYTPENANRRTSHAEIAGLLDRVGDLEHYS